MVDARASMHAGMHACIHAHTHPCMHMCVFYAYIPYVRTCIHACAHVWYVCIIARCIHVIARTHTCANLYIHTDPPPRRRHTHTHTHIHVCTGLRTCQVILNVCVCVCARARARACVYVLTRASFRECQSFWKNFSCNQSLTKQFRAAGRLQTTPGACSVKEDALRPCTRAFVHMCALQSYRGAERERAAASVHACGVVHGWYVCEWSGGIATCRAVRREASASRLPLHTAQQVLRQTA